MEMKFYVCSHCGNIIAYAKNSGVPVVCCGERMQELVPNTTDAAQEKHVPVCTQEGNLVTVEVGSTAHPMLEEHYIQFVILDTNKPYHKSSKAVFLHIAWKMAIMIRQFSLTGGLQ